MQIGIITIFPGMFYDFMNYGIIKNILKKNYLNLNFWNPRDYSENKKRKIDHKIYGGGKGMLMQPQPLKNTIFIAKKKLGSNVKTIYLSPKGVLLNQFKIIQLLKDNNLIIVCGRYKGIDERIIKSEIDEEISIGDYIISGGELAAMILIDAIARIIPGALKQQSYTTDSFFNGLLSHPDYTYPKIFNNMEVPEVLLSGNHKEIEKWRLKQALGTTWIKKPQLLNNINLTYQQKKLLHEFKIEFYKKKG
ncbi:MAG: tRNA (guanosine(37)-N1)-methyltransferase TrmD [Wigglesworthia glossinidia]|nr:tRNA (guanosine(37)-N1)-methyltransferase TrmD [Wigglesworthia glossinidia]